MEGYTIRAQEEVEDVFELPPGFRFHPTDEELITHYLSPKVVDGRFCARAIGEVDLNRVEPWELPCKGCNYSLKEPNIVYSSNNRVGDFDSGRAKIAEKECYFFCVRDRKYPTGLRTNRATNAGYWKATGKDKEIYRMKALVGMKKTLVFYKGRAPKGVKTNWVMHEYRLEGPSSRNLHQYSKNEWVICRAFQKTADRKRAEIPGLIWLDELQNSASVLPPLTDSSPYNCNSDTTAAGGASHITCFSDLIEDAATAKTMQREDFRASNDIIMEYQQESIPRLLMMQGYRTNHLRTELGPATSCFDRINGGDHQQHQQVDIDSYWQY